MGVTATDNCDNEVEITITEVETAEGDCEGLGSVVRTFTATDNCGNIAEATQSDCDSRCNLTQNWQMCQPM